MSWNEFLNEQQNRGYFQELQSFLSEQESLGKTIYPPAQLRFHAFDLTPLEKVKVVILGQDPYHGEGQAHGLSFSVPEGIKIPPSLRNMYKELSSSIDGYKIPESGNLEHWAKQGVLLLNAVLSVELASAGSHANKGWETFTDNAISRINQSQNGVIFLLWGSYAHKKEKLIDTEKHTVLKSTHPSPLSAYRGFLGCDHFRQVNEILAKTGQTAIIW
ncbi:uracil-DNA glycosylase [Psychromonas ossibalaenae]|uniref:uracil-DNA glycosylase n=1 Tax=Psychromonas ossibalaenae TaxID=444922 RepID=UPI00035D92E0|nr:uracil-DNA glycosylase [Psychromonas ossibalaenae]